MATGKAIAGVRSSARFAEGDALFVVLSILQGVILLLAPSIPVVAVGLWWNANTISHNFIHRPFFRAAAANRGYSMYLSLLLGLPQSWWRDRHLRHHGSHASRMRWTRQMTIETAAVAGLWTTLAVVARQEFVTLYVPGWLLGLGLCFLHGHYEHAGGTTSHYGRLYNLLFFNDGFHTEHHRHPDAHWTELAHSVDRSARTSRWPAVLRCLDALSLDVLERAVLRSRLLQTFVINRHARAFVRVRAHFENARRVTIVGGGLFPRTAIILRKMLPDAAITVVDASEANLAVARTYLGDAITYVHRTYDAGRVDPADLVVVPLAFRGDRSQFYRESRDGVVLVHDWLWRRPTSVSTIVSWWLLKRLNVVR
jgi:fatty acid desaturase